MPYEFETLSFTLRTGASRRLKVSLTFGRVGHTSGAGLDMEIDLPLNDAATLEQIEMAALAEIKDLLATAQKVVGTDTLQGLKRRTSEYYDPPKTSVS